MKKIIRELRNHSPFTLLGAATGIIIMLLFSNLPQKTSFTIFYILHPLHVVLSALVTASMYKFYRKKVPLIILFLLGYFGSVGIATLSDSLIPYLGEFLLKLPKREIHIGAIERWWLVNPLAILGVLIAYYHPHTKFPHAFHVLLSTWASLFHIIMAIGEKINLLSYFVIFIFLFLAVWFPCCLSDIIFPLIFVSDEGSNGERI
ncbi:MAG: hypothetical protein DRI36_02840 [Caldiserica bacterium]|nr:MAG: hypothetical protein DRI36_02840 [Caldisericota bacterium]